MKAQVVYTTKKLTELTPAKYNPRKISDESLEGLGAAIEEFGVVQPIVWNKQTGNIVGGHQRFKVLSELKVEDVQVCEVDLPENKERALNVALNNPHITGEFTEDLQGMLREIMEDDAELFRDINLDMLLKDEAKANDGKDPDGAPDLGDTAISQPGDIWLLGEHRVICGSSADHTTVMRIVGDAGAQCCWTDPPYGVDYTGVSKPRERIKNDTTDDVGKTLEEAFQLAFDYVMLPGSAIYVAHADGKHRHKVVGPVEKSGFIYRNALVWAKDTLVPGNCDYHFCHESVWYGCKPGDIRFGRNYHGWYGDHAQNTVFSFPRPRKSDSHPTMKPVGLVAAMIANSSRIGDTIYEPFAGSGTTLIACETLRRKCVALELEPLYVDVIVRRWEDFTGSEAKKL